MQLITDNSQFLGHCLAIKFSVFVVHAESFSMKGQAQGKCGWTGFLFYNKAVKHHNNNH